jgi:hypothetical protein
LSVNERLLSIFSKVLCSVGGGITKPFYFGLCFYCAVFIFNVDFCTFYCPAASFVIVLSDPSAASTMSCVTGLVSQDGTSMGSKSSFISVSRTPDRVGRQAMCCEAAESCNFQATNALSGLKPRNLAVSGLCGVKRLIFAVFRAGQRAVRCETAEPCGF